MGIDIAEFVKRVRWTMHSEGVDASNIGFNDGDLALQERLTRSIIDTAVRIGATTVLLPECGHDYGAARWEAAHWYGRALPVRIVHMTEYLDELITDGRVRVRPIGESATFHDPCRIVRRGGLEQAARRVLAALGLPLHEIGDPGVGGLCRGGGGGVVSNVRAAPLRQKVFEFKRAQVEATGAEHFATRAARRQGSGRRFASGRIRLAAELRGDPLSATASVRRPCVPRPTLNVGIGPWASGRRGHGFGKTSSCLRRWCAG